MKDDTNTAVNLVHDDIKDLAREFTRFIDNDFKHVVEDIDRIKIDACDVREDLTNVRIGVGDINGKLKIILPLLFVSFSAIGWVISIIYR